MSLNAFLRVIRRVRRIPWTVPVYAAVVGMVQGIIEIPKLYADIYWVIALAIFIGVLLGVRSWRAEGKKTLTPRERWQRATKAATFPISCGVLFVVVSTNGLSLIAPHMIFEARRDHDGISYLKWQVLNAAVREPAALRRAVALSTYLYNPKDAKCFDGSLGEKRSLIDDATMPDSLRNVMLHEDAACRHRVYDEVGVAEDFRRLAAEPFPNLNPHLAAYMMAYFELKDPIATRIILMNMKTEDPAAFAHLRSKAYRDPEVHRLLANL